MAKSFKCADAGVICNAKVTGETEEEVLAQAVEHAKKAHGVDLNRSTTLAGYARSLIKNESGMLAEAIATGWIIGWIVGAVVVVIAAVVLLAIIALGRRIASQAQDITAALDGARANTDPLFDVARTNLAIDRITRGLRAVRTGGSE